MKVRIKIYKPFALPITHHVLRQFGFTLVELLVAISIIGILTSLAIGSFNRIQEQARNTQRKNDLKQYQTALENYAQKNNSFYPEISTLSGPCTSRGVGNLLVSSDVMSSCLDDPRAVGSIRYWYQSDDTASSDGGATATRYVLFVKTEPFSVRTSYWRVCSDGRSGDFTLPSGSSAGLATFCP